MKIYHLVAILFQYIFFLEYSLYSSIIYIPLIILINSTIYPLIKTNFSNNHDQYIKIFFLIIIIQTIFTVLTNSLQKIIFDLPSIVEYESNNKEDIASVVKIRDNSIKQGISISSNLLIVPFLVSLTDDLGLNNLTWSKITNHFT